MLKNRDINIHAASVKELRAYIANEGKRLNQQLVEIQKRRLETTSFGYDNLVSSSRFREYLGTSKSGRIKINLNTRGLERGELQRLAGVIQKTVSYQTITVTGIKAYYGRVFQTLRVKYPELDKFSDDELADILKTIGWESAKGTVGSEQAFKMIGSVDTADKMLNFLEQSGGGQSISAYTREFRKQTGSTYVWQPATSSPFDKAKQ